MHEAAARWLTPSSTPLGAKSALEINRLRDVTQALTLEMQLSRLKAAERQAEALEDISMKLEWLFEAYKGVR